MHLLITFLLTAALTVVAVQDFKHRLISWWLIPLLLLLFAWNALSALSIREAGTYFVFNISFLVFQLAAVTAYLSIKNKRLVNIVNTWLGIGDILLFLVLCAAFSPVNYLLFYLLGLLVTIAGYIIYKLIKGRSGTIPLAGAVALCLLFCLLYKTFIREIDFYDDTLALQLLHLK